MDLWTVLSNSSTITSLAQVMIDLYTREEKLQQLHAVRIDNIIDYQSIAADLHTSFENLDEYLSSYHERYLTGKVLLQEERELFICAFFQKYPLLKSEREKVYNYLNDYLNKVENLFQKEFSLPQRVIFRMQSENSKTLRELVGLISDMKADYQKERSLKLHTANDIYLNSYCQPLFLHKNQIDTEVRLQNLYVMPDYSVLTSTGKFASTDITLEEELQAFLCSKKVALIIEGDAGSGKCSLISWINYHNTIRDDIGKRLFSNRPVLTIRLRDIDRDELKSGNHFDRMANAILHYLRISDLLSLVEWYPNAIIILDGFDELCMVEGILNHESLISDILERDLINYGIQFILTTRPKYIDLMQFYGKYVCVHLEHFSLRKRFEWVENYTTRCYETIPSDIESYICDSNFDYSEVKSDGVADLCDTPMSLYMICAKHVSIENIKNEWALYRQIFYDELSLTDYNRMFPNPQLRYKHPISKYKDILYQISEEIAFEMYTADSFMLQLSDKKIQEIILRILNESDAQSLASNEIRALSQGCYALCTYWKADGRKGFVEFYHNNIRDFFLCERIYRKLNDIYIENRNSNRIADISEFLTTNFSVSSLSTNVCKFILERSLFFLNTPTPIPEFPALEKNYACFPKVNETLLTFNAEYKLPRGVNHIERIINILVCGAQIFRYSAEPRLHYVPPQDHTQDEDDGLFQWWESVSNINSSRIMKYIFRHVFFRAPVIYNNEEMYMSQKSLFSGLDLSKCDLRGIDFKCSDLTNTNFSEALTEGCNFENTICNEKDF